MKEIRRIAPDNGEIRNVADDDGSGADERVLTDRDSREEHTCTAYARGSQNTRRPAVERECRAPVADPFVVHRHHAGPAEDVVFNDDSTRDIAAAL